MSLQQSPDLPSLLQNADEALAIETAVRTAVMSIMKVLLDVSDNRAKGYQLKLAEMERENIQLKLKLKAAERQLQTSQLSTCSGDSYEISADLSFSPETTRSLSSVMDSEAAAGCPQGGSEKEASLEASDCKMFKEEPAYEDTFWIKNEIAEEDSAVDFGYHLLAHMGSRTVGGQPQQQTMPTQRCGACNSLNHSVHEDDPASTSLEKKRLASSERVRQYRARIRADPERYHILKEKERLRYLRRRKTIADLSEPMKNLKRKAWREASKRHRARKLAQSTLVHTQDDQYVINTVNC
ncbi:uncharacterized protein [Salminus brasiliensis]|uniref:uncharacterized protein isoform X2 n=1 Tax=Salminus brasiliensis TaxID=930266 RepID=UPI003B82DBBF